jgi:hypothetical protein
MAQHFLFRLRRSLALCAVCAVLFCAARPLYGQGALGIGGYVSLRGGWNSSVTVLTRSEFRLANLPDIGLEIAYSVNETNDAAIVAAVGLSNYASRSVSYDIFTGAPTNEFLLNANAQYLGGLLGLRFLQFFGLPEFTMFMRSGLPLDVRYESTVDVFEVAGQAVLPDGVLRTYEVSNTRAQSFIELGADIGLLSFPVGAGNLTLFAQGSICLTPFVRILPLRTIPDNYNIVGLDPLAGLRTLNVQPFSVAFGLRYHFDVLAGQKPSQPETAK